MEQIIFLRCKKKSNYFYLILIKVIIYLCDVRR